MMKKFVAVILCFLAYAILADALADCPISYKGDSLGCPQWKTWSFCTVVQLADFMERNCKAACGYCKARPPPPPVAKKELVDKDACLRTHNAKRALHGVPALQWDAALARQAADYALKLARDDRGLVHSNSNAGENLFSGTSGGSVFSCAEAVSTWYNSEIGYYDFNNPESGKKTGHFTQVVWKSSIRLGVGRATLTKNRATKTFIVARYSPAGNNKGQFGQNVPRLVPRLLTV